jgi:CRISPR-associated protein Csb1
MRLEDLVAAVRDGAAFRRIRRLQPAGGPGSVVFPPTYPGEGRNAPPRHLRESRRIDGATVDCVLLSAVQSEANYCEAALEGAAEAGTVRVPRIVVNFAGTDVADIGAISSLAAPHRVYDAILRDSLLDGTPFPQSDVGRRLAVASLRDARALFEYAPTALVFGVWNSTGDGGGLGVKFPRVVVSEISGINAVLGKRPASRIDPLGIRAGIGIVKHADGGWDIAEEDDQPSSKAKKLKVVRPSEINHGNIAPSVADELGATFDYAVHTWVLSLAGLRRIRFGADIDPAAGRAALAALALVAHLERETAGYALRSRCDLIPDTSAPQGQRGELELIAADGSRQQVDITAERARALLREAVDASTAQGLPWRAEPLGLTPDPRLVRLVQRSRDLALRGEAAAEPG